MSQMTSFTSNNLAYSNSGRVSLGITCIMPGCERRIRSGSYFCINHGGGLRCMLPGCTSSARDGSIHCIKHGGGRRCVAANCSKGAVGKTDFCKSHGGGRRCLHPNCAAPARSGGEVQMCQRHGGGKRCKEMGCERVVAARSDHCKQHRELALRSADSHGSCEPGLVDERWAETTWSALNAPSREEPEESVQDDDTVILYIPWD